MYIAKEKYMINTRQKFFAIIVNHRNNLIYIIAINLVKVIFSNKENKLQNSSSWSGMFTSHKIVNFLQFIFLFFTTLSFYYIIRIYTFYFTCAKHFVQSDLVQPRRAPRLRLEKGVTTLASSVCESMEYVRLEKQTKRFPRRYKKEKRRNKPLGNSRG